MKRLIASSILLLLLTATTLFESCSNSGEADELIAVKSISLNMTTHELAPNETLQLSATVLPEDASNKNITWKSSDDKVAKVDDNGLVTAVADGSATITVTTVDGEKTATCAITVKTPIVNVESVSLDITEKELKPNETLQLSATVLPEDASNKNITWKSSDDKVAKVDDNGLVTAVADGSATITVTTVDGEKTATCAITVKTPIVNVESVSLDITEKELKPNETLQLSATVLPEDASNKNITWKSSDDKVAKVDDNGLVTAVADGSATITVTTVDGGKTATCAITVKTPIVNVESVSLDITEKELKPNETLQLSATVLPEDASNKNITWKSSDDKVAKVDDNGLVTAVADGSATITVTTVDGGKTATCAITVKTPTVNVESVSLDITEKELKPNETLQLSATVLPEDATDKGVTWRSSNKNVAKVNAYGVVTAVADGTATITAITVDGGKTATCAITVKTPIVNVESVSLDITEKELKPNETLQLSAKVLPENATDKSVTWNSSNQSVAKVNTNGLVTALSEGTTTITATTVDGGKTATCQITVKDSKITLKVVSFNITVSKDNNDNYWSSRRGAIVKFIKDEKPDIIGFQEITNTQISYLTSSCSGYSHYGIDRGGNNNGFERTSIMYNIQVLEIVDKGTFWLSPTPDTPSRSWSDEKTTQLELYLGGKDSQKYNRTCTWIKFKHRESGKIFYHFNTHLEYGYHAMHGSYPQELGLMGQTAREKGVELIIQRIKAKATNGEPVIFTGDMNQVANNKCFEPIWDYDMISGRVAATNVSSEANRNSITWNDYDATARDQDERNQGSPNSWNMIDHIFLKNCSAVEFRTIRDTSYGDEIDPKSNGGKYLADHFPVLLTVTM